MTREGQIKADLEVLYRAARTDFPINAETVGRSATSAGEALTDVRGEAQHLAVPAMSHAVGLCQDLSDALRRLRTSLAACGHGLESVADEFVATDSEAHDAFLKIRNSLPDISPNGRGNAPTANKPL